MCWVSVEHDVRWAERVRKILAKLPWGDKVIIVMMGMMLVVVDALMVVLVMPNLTSWALPC